MARDVIESGHRSQFMITRTHALNYRAQYEKRLDLPPRYEAFMKLCEKLGVINKWIYAKDLSSLLSEIALSDRQNAIGRFTMEQRQLSQSKTAVIRRASEVTGRQMTAMLVFSSVTKPVKIEAVVQELKFSLGAHGIRDLVWPIGVLKTRYVTGVVTDVASLQSFVRITSDELAQESKGAYHCELVVDQHPGVLFTQKDLIRATIIKQSMTGRRSLSILEKIKAAKSAV